MALSDLDYAALRAFAPFQRALIGGRGAILLGIAVTVGHGLSMRRGPGGGVAEANSVPFLPFRGKVSGAA